MMLFDKFVARGEKNFDKIRQMIIID